MRRPLTALLLAVGGLAASLAPVLSQVPLADPLEPASTGGLATVDRALAKLSSHRRLLVIGAHPDDEDTTLLTWVSRALGGESAYLSLTRGDGGQNLIGPELGVGLGLLRSEELLAARRIEGGRQFFTRAYDFGYTRSRDEAFTRWPKEVLLRDAMRVVRRFKPQVVVSVFPDDGRGGHGQHQAAGTVAHEVWRLAQQADAFPEVTAEGFLPWTPQALYRGAWWAEDEATLRLEMGVLEPLSGRSVRQIARASRSQHRSQDMGGTEPLGGAEWPLAWVAGGAGVESNDPFDGVDTRLRALASAMPAGPARGRAEARLDSVEAAAQEARRNLSPLRLDEAVEPLAAILGQLYEARDEAEVSGASVSTELIDEKIAVAAAGLAAAAGVAVEARSDRERVVPGHEMAAVVEVWNAGRSTVALESVSLVGPSEWPSEWEVPAVAFETAALAPNEMARIEPTWTVGSVAPTVPYFLRQPLTGDLFDLSDEEPSLLGLPFGPPPLRAVVRMTIAERPVTLEREVVHVYGDQAVGEIRRPLRVVPPLEVETSPALVLWPIGDAGTRRIDVRIRAHGGGPTEGTLDVTLGDAVRLAPIPFTIPEGETETSVPLELAPPDDRTAGGFRVTAVARIGDGPSLSRSLPLVDYPHIRPRPLPVEATTRVARFDLARPRLERIGYVRGASDRVPEVLQQVGLPIQILTPEILADGDLAAYDAIVVGSRAFEIDPALRAANGRLLAYAAAGGTVIVQYQQYQYVRGGFAPHPLEIGRPHGRVTDESARVVMLAPDHPVFTHPNRIAAEDWSGWVQERGLYFPDSWDEPWLPLLSTADTGEAEQRGALLVAEVGDGTYVYTGLAFFRQIPAGVPGALRLFVNLLALAEESETS